MRLSLTVSASATIRPKVAKRLVFLSVAVLRLHDTSAEVRLPTGTWTKAMMLSRRKRGSSGLAVETFAGAMWYRTQSLLARP